MRHRAVLIVIAIAGLASAATSASPPPPPDVVSKAGGDIRLTPEHPFASVGLVFHADAAIAAEAATSFTMTAEVLPEGGTMADGSVLYQVIAPDDTAPPRPSGWTDRLLGVWPVGCREGGPCDARYEFRAFLADPSVGTRRIIWGAAAEARYPDGVAVEPGAALTLSATDPVVSAANAMASATVAFEPVTVSRDHPRSMHRVRFSAPFGPPPGNLAAGSLLRVAATASDGEQTPPFRMLRATPPDRAADVTVYGPTLYDPFHACVEAEPCEGEYVVIFEWSGGSVDREATIEAQLSAWIPRPEGVPAAPGLSLSVAASEADLTGAPIRASLSGVIELERDLPFPGVVVAAVLDLQAIPQRTMVEGTARATLRTRVVDADVEDADPLDAAAGSITVRTGAAGDTQWQGGDLSFVVGDTKTVGSQLVDVVCQGRSRCPMAFEVDANARFGAAQTVRVDWELEVEVFAAHGAQLDSTATLELDVRPGP